MKRFLLSFLLMVFFGVVNAQEVENPRFKLQETTVSSTLQLETNPVNEMKINVQIFTSNIKDQNSVRLNEQLIIQRGKSMHNINVSELPSGSYFIEISQEKKGRIYRKQFTKE